MQRSLALRLEKEKELVEKLEEIKKLPRASKHTLQRHTDLMQQLNQIKELNPSTVYRVLISLLNLKKYEHVLDFYKFAVENTLVDLRAHLTALRAISKSAACDINLAADILSKARVEYFLKNKDINLEQLTNFYFWFLQVVSYTKNPDCELAVKYFKTIYDMVKKKENPDNLPFKKFSNSNMPDLFMAMINVIRKSRNESYYQYGIELCDDALLVTERTMVVYNAILEFISVDKYGRYQNYAKSLFEESRFNKQCNLISYCCYLNVLANANEIDYTAANNILDEMENPNNSTVLTTRHNKEFHYPSLNPTKHSNANSEFTIDLHEFSPGLVHFWFTREMAKIIEIMKNTNIDSLTYNIVTGRGNNTKHKGPLLPLKSAFLDFIERSEYKDHLKAVLNKKNDGEYFLTINKTPFLSLQKPENFSYRNLISTLEKKDTQKLDSLESKETNLPMTEVLIEETNTNNEITDTSFGKSGVTNIPEPKISELKKPEKKPEVFSYRNLFQLNVPPKPEPKVEPVIQNKTPTKWVLNTKRYEPSQTNWVFNMKSYEPTKTNDVTTYVPSKTNESNVSNKNHGY